MILLKTTVQSHLHWWPKSHKKFGLIKVWLNQCWYCWCKMMLWTTTTRTFSTNPPHIYFIYLFELYIFLYAWPHKSLLLDWGIIRYTMIIYQIQSWWHIDCSCFWSKIARMDLILYSNSVLWSLFTHSPAAYHSMRDDWEFHQGLHHHLQLQVPVLLKRDFANHLLLLIQMLW